MVDIVKRNAIGILTIFLLICGFTYFTIQLAPIHVLRNWHLSVPRQSYSRGSTVPLTSSSSKLRKVRGEAHRTIECDSGRNSFVDYPLNDSPAMRLPGTQSSVSNIIIPTSITNLPATCRIVISVTYKVYKFRKITENAVTNDFVIIQ